MGIAAIQAVVETDVLEKASLEFQINVVDTRRMMLTRKSGSAAENYSEILAQWSSYDQRKKNGDEVTEYEDEVWGSFSWDAFVGEYETQVKEIDYQDKALELERDNLQTKLTAVTTRLESNEKQLNQNIEKEFNYMK